MDLCQMIEVYPFLYDLKDPRYKNTDLKRQIFKKITRELNLKHRSKHSGEYMQGIETVSH